MEVLRGTSRLEAGSITPRSLAGAPSLQTTGGKKGSIARSFPASARLKCSRCNAKYILKRALLCKLLYSPRGFSPASDLSACYHPFMARRECRERLLIPESLVSSAPKRLWVMSSEGSGSGLAVPEGAIELWMGQRSMESLPRDPVRANLWRSRVLFPNLKGKSWHFEAGLIAAQ